ALALRGIAMAQLGELGPAKALLRRAAQGFGAGEPVARARCIVAGAEVALALRELAGSERGLEDAVALLAKRGDAANAAFARLVQVRRLTLLGEVERAERVLGKLALAAAPPRLAALLSLAGADLAMKRVDSVRAEQLLVTAREAATRAGIAPLLSEVEKAENQLRAPVARLREGSEERLLVLRDLPAVWASSKLVIDACRREVRLGKQVVSLVTRPILVELLSALGAAVPGDVARDTLIARVFGAKRSNDSHRVRLRVEVGRLRKLLGGLADVRATAAGFELAARGAGGCCVLLPPAEGEASALLALLRGGEAWATSALAAAVGKSQRAVQRALLLLERDGKVRAVGAGRARRWVGAPTSGFATTLLLVAPGSLG
ncbi:MAG TPA: helix-turn-helix domain-containing protein, partial [Polyangiaceae bacterium]